MTWLWVLCGFFGLGCLAFCIWWLIHLGKQIAEGEENKRQNITLEKQAKDKNQYLKDIDQISKGKDALKKQARDAFRRGSVGDIVRALNAARKGSTSDKT